MTIVITSFRWCMVSANIYLLCFACVSRVVLTVPVEPCTSLAGCWPIPQLVCSGCFSPAVPLCYIEIHNILSYLLELYESSNQASLQICSSSKWFWTLWILHYIFPQGPQNNVKWITGKWFFLKYKVLE